MVSSAKTLSSRALNALSVPDPEKIIPLVLLKEQREDSSDGELRMASVGLVILMLWIGSLYSLSVCVNMVHHDIALYSKDNYKGG